MNLLELRTETQRILAEKSATAAYSTPEDINKFINLGIKDMCERAFVYMRTKTLQVINLNASYTLPLDFLRVVSLNSPLGVALEPMAANLVGRVFLVAGRPLYYYITQTSLTTTVRSNLTVYSVETFLTPTVSNGFMYEVMVSGVTGAAPPTYSILPGNIVTDGSVTLATRELVNKIYAFTLVDTPTDTGLGTGTYTLIYNALDEGLYVDTDEPNFPFDKHHFLVSFAAMKAAEKGKNLPLRAMFELDYNSGLGLPIPKGENL